MTCVYLIRHAEAEGNVYRRCHGQYDSLLTPRAYEQLPYLAERFAHTPLDAVYASTLYRARHTAKAIADRQGLRVHVRAILQEIDMGDWEDATWALLPRISPALYTQWRSRPWSCVVPGGESVIGAGERVLEGIRQLARMHEGGEIAVVSHGSAIRGILCRALGLPPEQIAEVGWGDNTCVSKLLFDGDTVTAEYWNDASHLPAELSTFASIGWKNVQGTPETPEVWFRPYDPASADDRETLLRFARQFYTEAYGDTARLDPACYLEDTCRMVAAAPRAVTFGMLDETPVVLVRMNVCDESDPTVGMVGSFCIDEAYRGRGLSQQMLGQAISVCRALGKTWLCANVAVGNQRAQGFYRKFAFENMGEVQTENGAHFRMRKRIKVDTLAEEADRFICDD